MKVLGQNALDVRKLYLQDANQKPIWRSMDEPNRSVSSVRKMFPHVSKVQTMQIHTGRPGLNAPFADKEPSQEVIQRSTSHVDIEKEMCDESFKNNNDEVSNDENDDKEDKLSGGPDTDRVKHK